MTKLTMILCGLCVLSTAASAEPKTIAMSLDAEINVVEVACSAPPKSEFCRNRSAISFVHELVGIINTAFNLSSECSGLQFATDLKGHRNAVGQIYLSSFYPEKPLWTDKYEWLSWGEGHGYPRGTLRGTDTVQQMVRKICLAYGER